MNILYLAHRIPYPPNKGDKLRAFRQIEHLGRRHRVWCACFVDDPRDQVHVDALRGYCERLAALPLSPWRARVRGLYGLIGGRTITEAYYSSRAMGAIVRRWSRDVDFDVAVAFSSSMAAYALAARAARRVLDMCDRDSQKWAAYAEFARGPMRSLYRTEAVRLARREQQWVNAFDATMLITSREAEGLTGDEIPHDGPHVHIVGNGVNAVAEPSLPSGVRTERTWREAAGAAAYDRPPVVGFVGMMDYPPNVDGVCWFARECWPAIRRGQPTARFRIIGRSPARAVRRLAGIEGVDVVGEVAEVAHALTDVDVSVAPLRIARGLQNKVLEAMAAGKPVVMTRPVAASLCGVDQEHFVVCDSASDVACAVIELIGNPVLRKRIGSSARAFATEQYRWDVELEKFERIVTGVREATAGLWMSAAEAGACIETTTSRPAIAGF